MTFEESLPEELLNREFIREYLFLAKTPIYENNILNIQLAGLVKKMPEDTLADLSYQIVKISLPF